MISSQVIQTSIDELKAITKVDLNVYDLNGQNVAATTDELGVTRDLISGFANSPADSQVIGTHHLLKIYDDNELLYVIVASGNSDDVYMIDNGKIVLHEETNVLLDEFGVLKVTGEQYEELDKAYEDGIITRIFTTNLIYRTPELLARPWYSEVNMCKYVAYIIDTLNHDQTISHLLDQSKKIHAVLDKHKKNK